MAIRRSCESLYPKIKPYRTGYLPVGDGHEIYWEECGNLHGFPILFVHGGPGGGCGETDRRFFDPRKWRIMLFDQRGSGRSKPYASIVANTTKHLVRDIRTLFDYLGIRKIVLWGGSWGSTLSLVFSMVHPEYVAGMILRGIFLGDTTEMLKDYLCGIPHTRFPETWERFIAQVPLKFRSIPAEYYYAQMVVGNPGERQHFMYEWWRYETMRCYLRQPTEKELKGLLKGDFLKSVSLLEAHYYRRRCFLEQGYILKNAHRIPRVPIVIVHGRYDDVCPVEGALQLNRALPSSTLHIVLAGHSKHDPEIREKLITETDALYFKVKEQ